MSTFKSKMILDESNPYERMLSGFIETLRREEEVNHSDVVAAISSFIFNYHRISGVDLAEIMNTIIDEVEEREDSFGDCDPSRN